MEIWKQLKFPLTKADIADIIGISITTYIRWEEEGEVPKAERTLRGRVKVRTYSEDGFLTLLEALCKKGNADGSPQFPWLVGFDRSQEGMVIDTPTGYQIVI